MKNHQRRQNHQQQLHLQSLKSIIPTLPRHIVQRSIIKVSNRERLAVRSSHIGPLAEHGGLGYRKNGEFFYF